MKNYKPEQK